MKSTTSNKQLSKSVLFWIVLLTTLFAGQLQAQGVIYYSLENGSLVGLHMSVGPYNGPVLGPAGFFGTPPPPAATARNIAYDRVADLMWYAASDNHVHSIDWGSGNAGPTINDINDGIIFFTIGDICGYIICCRLLSIIEF